MEDLLPTLQEAVTNPAVLYRLLKAVVLFVIAFPVAWLASRALVRLFIHEHIVHWTPIVRRFSFYAVLGLFVTMALSELGVNLGVLLGAAGILTVALGFASQTSASNVISGLFLLGERPFSPGDIIRIGETTGEVLSIDLLSAKLRTFDNLYVRVPNETLVKSQIINLSRFPIRRVDLQIGVAYKEDIERVREVLLGVAERNPLCLQEPTPLLIFQGFAESALSLQFSVWARRENFLDLKYSIQAEIKEAFDEHAIEIPFPHRTLYAGSVTEPFPIRVVRPEADAPGAAGLSDAS